MLINCSLFLFFFFWAMNWIQVEEAPDLGSSIWYPVWEYSEKKYFIKATEIASSKCHGSHQQQSKDPRKPSLWSHRKGLLKCRWMDKFQRLIFHHKSSGNFFFQFYLQRKRLELTRLTHAEIQTLKPVICFRPCGKETRQVQEVNYCSQVDSLPFLVLCLWSHNRDP